MGWWWALLVAALTLLPACVVSPTPIPLPYEDHGVAADSGSVPQQDGAVPDAACMPDMGVAGDSSAADMAWSDGQPGDGAGDGTTGDGTGDTLPGEGGLTELGGQDSGAVARPDF